MLRLYANKYNSQPYVLLVPAPINPALRASRCNARGGIGLRSACDARTRLAHQRQGKARSRGSATGREELTANTLREAAADARLVAGIARGVRGERGELGVQGLSVLAVLECEARRRRGGG